jgi:hypothetical protein
MARAANEYARTDKVTIVRFFTCLCGNAQHYGGAAGEKNGRSRRPFWLNGGG